jgi:hypothetical protein
MEKGAQRFRHRVRGPYHHQPEVADKISHLHRYADTLIILPWLVKKVDAGRGEDLPDRAGALRRSLGVSASASPAANSAWRDRQHVVSPLLLNARLGMRY